MYYPKSQIVENLYTNGDEYMISFTSKPYKGYYYQVSNNQRFTGKNPNDKPNNVLVPIRDDVDYGNDLEETQNTYWAPSYKFLQKQQGIKIGRAPQSPKQIIPQPTSQDYNNGFFNRYFLYNFTQRTTKETNQQTYQQLEVQNTAIDQ